MNQSANENNQDSQQETQNLNSQESENKSQEQQPIAHIKLTVETAGEKIIERNSCIADLRVINEVIERQRLSALMNW